MASSADTSRQIWQQREPVAALLHGDDLHGGFCMECAKRLHTSRCCPVCRKKTDRVVKLF